MTSQQQTPSMTPANARSVADPDDQYAPDPADQYAEATPMVAVRKTPYSEMAPWQHKVRRHIEKIGKLKTDHPEVMIETFEQLAWWLFDSGANKDRLISYLDEFYKDAVAEYHEIGRDMTIHHHIYEISELDKEHPGALLQGFHYAAERLAERNAPEDQLIKEVRDCYLSIQKQGY